jgi:hypothetical protein
MGDLGFRCWAFGLLGHIGLNVDIAGFCSVNRELTGEFRFSANMNRIRTEFFGSGSFGSGSRFFRFGSRFSVFCAQG